MFSKIKSLVKKACEYIKSLFVKVSEFKVFKGISGAMEYVAGSKLVLVNAVNIAMSFIKSKCLLLYKIIPSPLQSFVRGMYNSISKILMSAPELSILILATIGLVFVLSSISFTITTPAFFEGKGLIVLASTLIAVTAKLSDITYEKRYSKG